MQHQENWKNWALYILFYLQQRDAVCELLLFHEEQVLHFFKHVIYTFLHVRYASTDFLISTASLQLVKLDVVVHTENWVCIKSILLLFLLPQAFYKNIRSNKVGTKKKNHKFLITF